MLNFVESDTGSVLEVRLVVQSTLQPLDLSDCTATLKYKPVGGDAEALVERSMSIAVPGSGVATYQFATGELDPGQYEMEVMVTDFDGNTLTTIDQETIQVRPRT